MITGIVALFAFPASVSAQPWKLSKAKDGITIYTRDEPGSSCKSFKGEVDLHTDIHKVFAIVGDVNSCDDWDPNIKLFKPLVIGKDSSFSYYLIYSTPWPLHDRDLCVEVKVICNPVTGEIVIDSKSRPDLMPEASGIVRIRNYWQKWILQPIDSNHLHLVIVGFADPSGNIPAWLSNMALTETPYNMLLDIRKKVE